MARSKPHLSQEEFLKHADNASVALLVNDVVERLDFTVETIKAMLTDKRLARTLMDHERANLSDIVIRLRAELSYIRGRKSQRIDAQTKRSKRILAADKKNR
jgi:hypothetical protein